MSAAVSPWRAPPTGRGLAGLAAGLLALSAAVLLACSLWGPYGIPLGPGWQIWEWPIWRGQVWQMRAGRLLAAAAVGAGLASGGAAIQGLLRNPLAEPYLLGISSGAGVGVRLGAILAARRLLPPALGTWLSTPVLAFAGAVLTCAAVYGIAQQRGRLNPYSLILSGVILNTFNTAIMLGLSLLVDVYHVDEFSRWIMGELPDAVPGGLLALCGALVAGGWLVLFLRGAAFNVLGLGYEVAHSSGVAVGRLRLETFAVVGLMTAAAVALAGPIGFVGLIVPHICRMAFGPDHRRLALLSGFAGAVFLMTADTLCRNLGPALGVGRLPVGVVTALVGGPFFIYLMRRGYREREA